MALLLLLLTTHSHSRVPHWKQWSYRRRRLFQEHLPTGFVDVHTCSDSVCESNCMCVECAFLRVCTCMSSMSAKLNQNWTKTIRRSAISNNVLVYTRWPRFHRLATDNGLYHSSRSHAWHVSLGDGAQPKGRPGPWPWAIFWQLVARVFKFDTSKTEMYRALCCFVSVLAYRLTYNTQSMPSEPHTLLCAQ